MSGSDNDSTSSKEEKKEKPNLPPIPDKVREASLSKKNSPEINKQKEEEDESRPPVIEYTIIGGDGEEYGPASRKDLARWIVTGKANHLTLVRTDQKSAWTAIQEIPELANLLEKQLKKPRKVRAIAAMTLIGGIIATIIGFTEALGITSTFCIGCFLIPGSFISFFGGIFAIIQGALLFGKNPGKHLKRTRITASIQIACILAGDIVNLILGILNHVFLSDQTVVEYRNKTVVN
jgi:hypothetical protein